MALRAQGRCGFDGVVGFGASRGWGRHGSTVLRAWERHRVHSIAGSRTAHAWSTMSPLRVGEDGDV
jgi:hypothetical protein